MAKTITDERIKLTIEVTGNEAQKELLNLEKATRKLTEENVQYRLEKKRLEAQGKKDTAEYKLLTASIKQNTITITANKAKMAELQKEIGLTGLTMTQLRQKATILRSTLSNMVPGSADFQRYTNELRQVNARISELSGKAQTARFSLGGLADGFNRYQALAFSFVAALTGVVLSIQKILDINGKLSDSQSDVMKTTGMTKKEVDELTRSFGLMKTRTARIELLGLATEAGRLGIEGTENIRAFVEQANKLKVALGDDLSDEAIREVGKMVNVYKVGEETGKDFAGSMDALGSSINQVAASGANQAGFLVDYLKRQAGIASQTKLSAADNIGYAATFDEIGQSVEVSATAMNKVWMDMFENPEQYAKIAKMSIKDFNTLLQTDGNEAMIKFLEGLKGNNGGLAVMLDKLKDLDVGGTRGVQALSALANNTEILRDRQLTSNQALIEATSLTDEYNLKNNNLAASLEKLQKVVAGVFSSQAFINWLSGAVEWISKFVGASEDADGNVTKWRNGIVFTAKIIAVFTAALVTNVAWQKLVALWTARNTEATLLYNIATKASAVAQGISMIVTQAWAGTMMLLRGNVIGALQAFRVMTATMLTTPWGFILAAIAAIGAAYLVFSDNVDKASINQKRLNDLYKESNSNLQEHKDNLQALLAIAKDETASKEARLKAIKAINEISPEYLGNIKLETITTNETTAAINRYIGALDRKLQAEAIDNAIRESRGRLLEIEKKELENYAKWSDNFLLKITGAPKSKTRDTDSENTRKADDLKYENDLIKSLLDKRKQLFITSANESGLTSSELEPLTPEINNKTQKKYDDSYLNDEKKMAEELLKLQRDNEEARINALKSSYAREFLMEVEKHQQKLEDNKMANEDIIKLEHKLSKDLIAAEKAKDYKKIASVKSMQGLLREKKTELAEQIEHDEDMHHLRLGTIQEKAGVEEIENIAKEYERQKMLRETAFNEELAQLNLSEEEKVRRKDQFQKEELAKEEAYLNQQIEKYKDILSGKDIDGIQFNLLTEEQKDKLAEDLEKIMSAIAKIKAAKEGKDNDSSKEIDLGLGGQTDVLGFTQDQWDKFFQNIDNGTVGLQTMQMAIGALSNLWSQFNQYLDASENAQFKKYEKGQDKRKDKLKQQLDRGYINQAQYSKGIEKIDKETDKQKGELEYKQAKRQKILAAANIIQSTAQAIIGIWAQFPKFDFGATAGIMSGVVGALGALQLATVLKTPLPARGYEDGFYPVKREQDGKMYNAKFGGKSRSGIVRKPTVFLAGENGENFPEMIIDGRSYSRFSPELKQAMDRELKGIKGFENGFYNQATQRYEVPKDSTSSSSNNDLELIKAMYVMLAENTAVMKDLRDSGIIAYFSKDMRDTKKLKEQLDEYQTIKNKAKQ
ncbi:phage tail tape measure protein [uncultured Flavobacterium sp.]|uniref:phage tail tape measure protein n=1 Tax=uncultured Flavobacterium sp. TaxID=165435 RepID=UPI0030ED9F44